MEGPSQETPRYYVYGFWHIYPEKEIIWRNDKRFIREFDTLDKATEFVKKQVESNINTTWCICRDKDYMEELKASDRLRV